MEGDLLRSTSPIRITARSKDAKTGGERKNERIGQRKVALKRGKGVRPRRKRRARHVFQHSLGLHTAEGGIQQGGERRPWDRTDFSMTGSTGAEGSCILWETARGGKKKRQISLAQKGEEASDRAQRSSDLHSAVYEKKGKRKGGKCLMHP